jgi:hypothetical protein
MSIANEEVPKIWHMDGMVYIGPVLVFINLTLVLYSHLLITYTLLYQGVIPGNKDKDVCWHYLALLLSSYLVISCD